MAETATDVWTTIVEAGWAPEFAAASVLSRLRDPNDAVDDGQRRTAAWYYQALLDMGRGHVVPSFVTKASHRQRFVGRACACWARLDGLLTDGERRLLRLEIEARP